MKRDHTVYIRMDIELYEKIRKIAKQERRSVSGQIKFYLEKQLTEESFSQDKNIPISDLPPHENIPTH